MAQKGLSQAVRAISHTATGILIFYLMLLWGIPVCSQTSYAKGTSTKLLPCSTLTSRSTTAVTEPSHLRITSLPYICAAQPLPLPLSSLLPAVLQTPRAMSRAEKSPKLSYPCSYSAWLSQHSTCALLPPLGFVTFSVACCHLASCVHTTSQAKVVCFGINFCSSGAQPDK